MNEYRFTRQIIGIVCRDDSALRRVRSAMHELGFYAFVEEHHPFESNWSLISAIAPDLADHPFCSRECWRELIVELAGIEVECQP